MDNEAHKVAVEITDEGPLICKADGPAGTWWGVSRTTALATQAVAAAAFGDHPGSWLGDGSPYTVTYGSKKQALEEFAKIEEVWSLMVRCGLNLESIELVVSSREYWEQNGDDEMRRVLAEVEGYSGSTADIIIREMGRLYR